MAITQGTERLDPVFDAFLVGFAAKFGVTPLSLNADVVDRPGGKGKIPRLGVVLERSAQYESFRAGEGNFDPAKQRSTAKLLVASLGDESLHRLFDAPHSAVRATPWADEIFIYFEDFERTAKWEAHESVTGPEIDSFVDALALGDQLWRTERFVGPPTVFVFTDEQADALRASEAQDRWAEAYFSLVHRHDEFGYIRQEEIHIAVDSKGNFDRNYEGNWYYYFK